MIKFCNVWFWPNPKCNIIIESMSVLPTLLALLPHTGVRQVDPWKWFSFLSKTVVHPESDRTCAAAGMRARSADGRPLTAHCSTTSAWLCDPLRSSSSLRVRRNAHIVTDPGDVPRPSDRLFWACSWGSFDGVAFGRKGNRIYMRLDAWFGSGVQLQRRWWVATVGSASGHASCAWADPASLLPGRLPGLLSRSPLVHIASHSEEIDRIECFARAPTAILGPGVARCPKPGNISPYTPR
jgi:hypothetical protein